MPATGTYVFLDCNLQDAILFVPASAINDYKATAPWNQFGTIKEISSTSINTVNESVPLLISAHNGTITVKGELDGQAVTVYSADGKMMGSDIIRGGQATVNTSLDAGSVAIVKVGQRAVKVMMK